MRQPCKCANVGTFQGVAESESEYVSDATEAQVLIMPECPYPRPWDFPFFQGTPLPPWTPRGWCIPAEATEPPRLMATLKLKGIHWTIPGGGSLELCYEGPPGLSEITHVVFSWGLVCGCPWPARA